MARDGEVRAALTAKPRDRALLVAVAAGIVSPFLVLSTTWRGVRRAPVPRAAQAAHILGPLLTLTGGFALRTLMVLAGRDSADDPGATFRFTHRSHFAR